MGFEQGLVLELEAFIRGILWEVLRALGQGIWLAVLLAWDPSNCKAELREKFASAYLSTCELFCLHEVLQILVISEECNLMIGPH